MRTHSAVAIAQRPPKEILESASAPPVRAPDCLIWRSSSLRGSWLDLLIAARCVNIGEARRLKREADLQAPFMPLEIGQVERQGLAHRAAADLHVPAARGEPLVRELEIEARADEECLAEQGVEADPFVSPQISRSRSEEKSGGNLKRQSRADTDRGVAFPFMGSPRTRPRRFVQHVQRPEQPTGHELLVEQGGQLDGILLDRQPARLVDARALGQRGQREAQGSPLAVEQPIANLHAGTLKPELIPVLQSWHVRNVMRRE